MRVQWVAVANLACASTNLLLGRLPDLSTNTIREDFIMASKAMEKFSWVMDESVQLVSLTA